MIFVPDSQIQLPASAIESRPTRYPDAWVGHVLTVELYSLLDVTRHAERPNGLLGDWFALDAAPGDPAEIAARYAIPARGNAVAPELAHRIVWRLLPGTLLNVGRCAPLFGLPGLGFQAEFLDGPLPVPLGA